MYCNIPPAVMLDFGLNGNEKIIISWAMSMKNGITMSNAQLAQYLGCSRRTVINMLNGLQKRGYILVIEKKGVGRTVYPVKEMSMSTEEWAENYS